MHKRRPQFATQAYLNFIRTQISSARTPQDLERVLPLVAHVPTPGLEVEGWRLVIDTLRRRGGLVIHFMHRQIMEDLDRLGVVIPESLSRTLTIDASPLLQDDVIHRARSLRQTRTACAR